MIKQEIDNLEKEYQDLIEKVEEMKELERLHGDLFGKKGELSRFMNRLKSLDGEKKAEVGKDINRIKKLLKTQLKDRKQEIQKIYFNKKMEDEWVDITIDPIRTRIGSLHPITIVQNELEDIFMSMGFRVLDGPHIENKNYSSETFDLWSKNKIGNMQNTFDFENGYLLRKQLFTMLFRSIEKISTPLKIIGAGKVFTSSLENETLDNCHHKIGGMIIDKDISIAHLHYFIQEVLCSIFKGKVKIWMRPEYNPFFEPGFVLDMACLICEGNGCGNCRSGVWDSLLGCGMVHPKFLKAGGIDPTGNCGLAFEIDIERIVWIKFGIKDMWAIND